MSKWHENAVLTENVTKKRTEEEKKKSLMNPKKF